MKVIITADLDTLGKKGQVAEVARGYYLNFLFPNGYAVEATPGNLKNLDATIKSAVLREKKEKSRIEEIAKVLREKTYAVKAKCGPSGKLFGAITAADVSKIIRDHTKIDIDKRKVELADVIKKTGEHSVTLKLHPDVQVELKLTVEAE